MALLPFSWPLPLTLDQVFQGLCRPSGAGSVKAGEWQPGIFSPARRPGAFPRSSAAASQPAHGERPSILTACT